MQKVFSLDLNGQKLIIETGKLAQMANGSAVVTMGGSSVLATAVMSPDARDGIDFLPLMVNYQEKMYAAGMIKSSRFNKRETRPSDDKILMSRLIDRQLRPLFSKYLRNDIQLMLTTLSYDRHHEHDILSAIGASAALAISDIPWSGPTASVRVGLIDGQFVLNPSPELRAQSQLDLVVASSEHDVVMIESSAKEITEEKMLEAIAFGKKWGQEIARFIAQIASEIGKAKREIEAPEKDEELMKFLKANYEEEMNKAIFDIPEKQARFARKAELAKDAQSKAKEFFGEEKDLSQLYGLFDEIFKGIIRDSILNNEKRIAGRKLTEIRPLKSEVGLFQRTHGTGLFNRGETQCLSIATLDAPGTELITEGIEGELKESYMHHYNFPPFSVGEASNRLFTGNREIGHGALAEKALRAVLPNHEEFPYVIRVVSEILQSNGSSSMAATCGSTLALMDAGVPITAPVSGIAMGLMTDDSGNFKILSDIQDEEDFGGDMDFKVAGTAKGITAIQMDTKIMGISEEIFAKAFMQAKEGRAHILASMLEAISAPRDKVSDFAPRIEKFSINPDKIREVIGKGGETINKIIDETGVKIDLDKEKGLVIISSVDGESLARARQMVEDIVAEPEIGQEYIGKVVRLEAYGAFVEFMGSTQGLLHISQVSEKRTESMDGLFKIGQNLKIKVLDIDRDGKVKLTLRGVEQNA